MEKINIGDIYVDSNVGENILWYAEKDFDETDELKLVAKVNDDLWKKLFSVIKITNYSKQAKDLLKKQRLSSLKHAFDEVIEEYHKNGESNSALNELISNEIKKQLIDKNVVAFDKHTGKLTTSLK